MRAKYNIATPTSLIDVGIKTQEGVVVSLETERGNKDVGFHYRYEGQYEEFDKYYSNLVCVGTDIESGMIVATGDNIMKCAILAKSNYNSDRFLKITQGRLYQKCVQLIRGCEQREGE